MLYVEEGVIGAPGCFSRMIAEGNWMQSGLVDELLPANRAVVARLMELERACPMHEAVHV